jgi:hypothetical protein
MLLPRSSTFSEEFISKVWLRRIMDVKPKLLDQVRQKIRFKHYSIRTDKPNVDWIRRYILYHQKRHPQDMGKPEVEQFLSALPWNATSRYQPKIRR